MSINKKSIKKIKGPILIIGAGGFDCGHKKYTLEMVDDNFIDDLENKYFIIKEKYLEYLSKYHVNYLIIDRQEDDRWQDFNPLDYSFELLYNDNRFDIYKFIN